MGEDDEPTVTATVVEGEADEDEDEDEEAEEEEDDDDPSEKSSEAIYPGLQLPSRHTSGAIERPDPSSSESEVVDDFSSSFFPSTRFGGEGDTNQNETEYYYSTDLQRKGARQNNQLRYAWTARSLQILGHPTAVFKGKVGTGISESILGAQEISQNLKNANEDLLALTDTLSELKSFPTSLLV